MRRSPQLPVYMILLSTIAAAAAGTAAAQIVTPMELRPILPQVTAGENVSVSATTRVGGFFRVPELPYPKGPWPARKECGFR